MTSLDRACIDAAIRIIRNVGRLQGYDVTVLVRHDGRVDFVCENAAGFVKENEHAVIDGDGSMPEPGEALLRLDGRLRR